MHRKVVEGIGEDSARCVVHVDVHGECAMLMWVAAMQLIQSMAGIICLVCRNCVLGV